MGRGMFPGNAATEGTPYPSHIWWPSTRGRVHMVLCKGRASSPWGCQPTSAVLVLGGLLLPPSALSLSGPPGVGSLGFPVLLQGWTPRVAEPCQQESSCFRDRAPFCKPFPDEFCSWANAVPLRGPRALSPGARRVLSPSPSGVSP